MKVAIIRGASLNKFEMQYYEPMQKWHEITCFCATNNIFDLEDISLPIVKLPCWGQIIGKIPGGIKILYKLFGDPQGLIGLEEKLKGFDLAHSAELTSYYTYQTLRAKKRGWVKKVIATVSENIPHNLEDYPRQLALKKDALKHLDHILAISNLSKQILIKEGYSEDKITVIGHGIDLKKFKVKSLKCKVTSYKLQVKKDVSLLFVGRLVEEKGAWEVLEAFKCLNKSYPNLRLVMVGKGPLEGEIKKWIMDNGLMDKIEIKGGVKYEEMPEIYQKADIFVLASKKTRVWQEQFGMVLIEAMACGVPVVASKSGAIPETLGDAGLLFRVGDQKDLVDKIKMLLDNPNLRVKYSKLGRERVEGEFDWKLIAKKINQVYRKLLC